jgi:vacuolar-type H+-ATPase subunit C/Vma6
MITLNAILKEIKNIPSERLEELYQFVHSLNPKKKKTIALKEKIMSYAGAFSDMSENDYQDFLKETRRTRNELFDRDASI